MSVESAGRLLMIIGLALALSGAVLWLLARAFGPGILRWFGNLPGDIVIKGNGLTCIVPIVSMLLVSVVLTVLLNIIIRLISR